MAMDQLHSAGSEAEVRYWYTEWMPQKYFDIQSLDFETAWNRLYDEIRSGWSINHYDICERMIKGHPYFESIWESEHGSRVNEKKH